MGKVQRTFKLDDVPTWDKIRKLWRTVRKMYKEGKVFIGKELYFIDLSSSLGCVLEKSFL